jgi:S1-C subfamily serine protease
VDIGKRFLGTGIMGVSVPVVILVVDEEKDLAVFQTPDFSAPGVKLGKAPKVGADILVAGHPFGYPDVFLTRGWVASLAAELDPGRRRKMIFDVAGAPGNSGSPVFNKGGQLVSILQIGWSRSFSPVTGGALWMDVKTIAGGYFQGET